MDESIDRRSDDPAEESYVILPHYGCAVTIGAGEVAGVLFDVPLMAHDGEPDRNAMGEIEWSEVTAPDSQVLLDTVNQIFGTQFRLEQFPGR